MANIPRPAIQDFQLGSVRNVISVKPVDLSSINQFGRVLMDEGLQQAADEARQEGIQAQAQQEDGQLVRKDSGFFGFFDKEFDEGAKYIYQKQKQNEIDRVVSQAQINNPFDPNAYEQEIVAEREAIFSGVPADVLPGVKLYWDNEVQKTGFAVQKDGAVREIKFQQDQFRLDVDTAADALELEVEQTGVIPVELEARLVALKERGQEIGMQPEELAALENTVRDRVFISKQVNTYRNLDLAGRRKFMANLMSDKGPLRTRPISERLGLATKLRHLDDADKALFAAKLSGLKARLDQAMAVTKNGHKVQDQSQLLTEAAQAAAVTGDSALQSKIRDYMVIKNSQVAVNQARAASGLSIDETVDFLKKKNKTTGFSASIDGESESRIFNELIKLQDERTKTNLKGNWQDYVDEFNVEMPDDYENMSRADRTALLEVKFGRYERRGDEVVLTSLANVNPFKDAEVQGFKNAFEKGNFTEKAQVVRTVSDELKNAPAYRDKALAQIAKDSVELGVVTQLVSNPETERVGLDILEGMEFLEGEGSVLVAKKNDTMSNILGVVSSALPFNGSATHNAYAKTIFALYANDLRVNDGKKATSALSATKAEELFNRVIGGEIWTMPSGAKSVPLKPKHDKSANKNLWNSMTDDALKAMSGGSFPIDNRNQSYQGTEVTWERIRGDGRLQPTGNGKFYVLMPSRPGELDSFVPLMNPNTGQRFVFDPELIPVRQGEFVGDPSVDLTLSP